MSDKMEQITGQGCRALKIVDVATRFCADFCPAKFPPFPNVDSEFSLGFFLFLHKYFIIFLHLNVFLLMIILSCSKSDTSGHLACIHTQRAVRCLPPGTKSSSSCKRGNSRACLGDLS